jgi:hypothetical protein
MDYKTKDFTKQEISWFSCTNIQPGSQQVTMNGTTRLLVHDVVTTKRHENLNKDTDNFVTVVAE